MLRYLARRLLWMVPTLLGIALVTFLLLRLAPGDPAQIRFGGDGLQAGAASARALERFREQHLLDQPLWKQFLHYLGPFDLSERGARWLGGSGERPWHGLLAGDLGREYLRPDVSVAAELGRRLRVTVPLALAAALLSYLVAIPLGVIAAMRQGRAFDHASALLVFVLFAVPTFWAALLLQLAFGEGGLGWLPVIGLSGKDAAGLSAPGRALDLLKHAVLPVACLAYGGVAYLSRQMRAGMLEAIRQDYVRTARAKGLSERAAALRHALPNSLIPVLTLLGQVLPLLVGGSVIVETVFDLPGVGKYAYEGLLNREYDVVMGTVLLSALMTLAGFLLSDLLYALVDPRIRYE